MASRVLWERDSFFKDVPEVGHYYMHRNSHVRQIFIIDMFEDRTNAIRHIN